MNLRRVYIKRTGGEIGTEACYTAWKGFFARGYPLDFFVWQNLKNGCLVLDPTTLVVGGTTTMHMELAQIGLKPPKPLNIPEALHVFRHLGQTEKHSSGHFEAALQMLDLVHFQAEFELCTS